MYYLNVFCCHDEINSIRVVLLYPCCNGKDVGVKYDIIRIELDLVNKNPVGSLTYFKLSLSACCLKAQIYGTCIS